MAKMLEIDTSKIYTSKNYGDFKIIEEVERIGSNRYVKIQFIKTGYECEVALSSVTKGAVKDPTYIPKTDFVHPKYGPYKILDKYSRPDYPKNLFCHVLFERTGTILEFLYQNAIKGEIKNPYDKVIYGVACIGIPRLPYNDHIYNVWHNILTRVFNPKYDHYDYYGGAGVTVCERWRCFEYFLEDAYKLPNGEHAFEDGWQLDKDTLQPNYPIKIYSPETCMWIPAHTNQALTALTRRINGNASTIHYGVREDATNSYSARITDENNKTKYIGSYYNDIAAANSYNREAINIGNKQLNNVPYMSAYQILSYKYNEPAPNPNMCTIVPREMCVIVDKNK